MALHRETETALLKPIIYTYNPGLVLGPRALEDFNILRSNSLTASDFKYSLEIDPSSLRLPWPSSFPASRQCKHWRDAENACISFLQEVYAIDPSERGKLPDGVSDQSTELALSQRARSAITNAVNAAIYMNPEASATRISMVTKFYLLAWLHDGQSLFHLVDVISLLRH
jgi:hypothetical protein